MILKKKAAGFRKGLLRVSVGDSPSLRKKLFKALGISSDNAFWKYSNGYVEMRESQSEAVRKVFEEYGITDYRDE